MANKRSAPYVRDYVNSERGYTITNPARKKFNFSY